MLIRTSLVGLAVLLTGVVVVRAQDAAAEEEFVKIREFPQTERELNKDVEGVAYSRNSNKFSRTTKVPLKVEHVLRLTVWSFDFQPRVTVRAAGQRGTLKAGVYAEPKKLDDGRTAYTTYLDFPPPDRGVYEVTVTTKDISQGKYFIEGAIWGPPPEKVEEAEGAAGSIDGLKNLKFDEPDRSKNWDDARNHAKWGQFVDGTKDYRGKEVPNIVGYAEVKWLETGDTLETFRNPMDENSGWRDIERMEDDVYYFKPDTRKDAKGNEIVWQYKALIFEPDKEIYSYVTVPVERKELLPSLIEYGKQLIAEHEADARAKP